MDRFYGSRLQGRSRPLPGKQGHLRRRRELCFSPILVGTTKKRDLLRRHRTSGIRTQWGWLSPADGEEKTRDAEDLKEISGSRHYKEGDLDFSPVLENKKSIADADEEDAAHSLSPTPEYLPLRTLVSAVFLQHSKAGFCNIFFLFARKTFPEEGLS
ncbi:hypothetical protein MRB53_014175 [Persea americana]|uniref:Uncharacterized protein n=1 Tax=Persea americana TaxID=3435 RepID=A0ACC2KA45_PERAE|nr:hypothetical protein MRB53_014175 [Persea americana]